jgi:hypothetical protein
MDGQRSFIVVLIASAYLGGAATLAVCWHYSVLLAIAAAPFGGSLAVLGAALLLHRYRARAKARPVKSSGASLSNSAGSTRWIRRSNVGTGGSH